MMDYQCICFCTNGEQCISICTDGTKAMVGKIKFF